jgi:hypothetical protein
MFVEDWNEDQVRNWIIKELKIPAEIADLFLK